MKSDSQRPFFGVCVFVLCVALLGTSLSGPNLVAARAAQPAPHNQVRIMEGDSYQVPAGHVLSIRTFGSTSGFLPDLTLKFDGQVVFGVSGMSSDYPLELVLGVTATTGEVVTLENTFPFPGTAGVAFGFLSRAAKN